MELFPQPKKSEFTIYSKSGCPNCLKSKQLLKDKHYSFSVIDCDEFLIENKPLFLSFIEKIAKKEVKMFPMIFDCNKYVGGYNELVSYIDSFQRENLDFDMSF